MGIGLMYGGLRLGPGDEVLDHHPRLLLDRGVACGCWRERTGATISQVTLYDDPAQATVDEMVGRLAAGITPRTKVVALTWVHSSTGVRVPVQEICAALDGLSRVPRDQYVVCVDGVHGFSAVDVDLPDLGCDFLAAGTHKWLFGPRGTGSSGAATSAADRGHPVVLRRPGHGAARITAGGYHAFEHQWALADAFGFMSEIGRDRVVARTVEQATRLKEGLAAIPGLTLSTPMAPELSAGIVCFDVPRPCRRTPCFAARAGHRGQRDAVRTSYLRLGPSIATSPDQVDQALEAVGTLV